MKHGHTWQENGVAKTTPTYRSWMAMRRRCLYPKHHQYKNYGARGITICKGWKEFKNFLKDMGKRPSLKHSIDRINVNGNYEKKNCRWATAKEQGRNQRSVKLDLKKASYIRHLYRSGMSQRKIAKLYGMDQSSISDVVTGKSWI